MQKCHQRDKIERLCRYIARPAVSEKRLSLTSTGKLRPDIPNNSKLTELEDG